jgi:uncharacterized membrane protein YfcA
MDKIRSIYAIIVGLVCGFVVGLLGTPGYAMIVPALLVFAIVPEYTKAIGTYLLALAVPLTAAGAYIYYQNDNVDVNISFILMATLFLGIIGGSFLADSITVPVKERIAGLIESVIGPFYLLRSFGYSFGLSA